MAKAETAVDTAEGTTEPAEVTETKPRRTRKTRRTEAEAVVDTVERRRREPGRGDKPRRTRKTAARRPRP
ncbi:hypothetical protein GCM10023238_38410 [Streptomyces heliomycini]